MRHHISNIQAKWDLTETERRFWFEWQLAPSSTSYNTDFRFNLSGALNISILRKAITLLVQSEEYLRSIFVIDNNQQARIVLKKYNLLFQKTKHSNSINHRSLLKKFYNTSFDITKSPPWDYLLLKSKKNKYILLFKFHHILVDAFYAQKIFKNLSNIYSSLILQKHHDYIKNDNSFKNTATYKTDKNSLEYQNSLNYWRKKFKNYHVKTLDIPELASSHNDGKRYYLRINRALSKRVMYMMGSYGCTIFMFIASILVAIMKKYLSHDDIIISYTSNLRDKNTQDISGCHINILPLICSIDNNCTFDHLLQMIKSNLMGDRLHSYVQLTDIIRISKDTDAQKKWFNTQLSHTTSVSFTLDLFGIESKIVPRKNIQIQPGNDLTVRFDIINNQIVIEIEVHNTEVAHKFTRSLIKGFDSIISSIVSDVDLAISEIPFIDSGDSRNAEVPLAQRERIKKDVAEQQLAYWKKQLAYIPDLLQLPTDRPRPQDLTYNMGVYRYTLSKHIQDKLSNFSHDNQASLFITLLSILQILLYRYSGQNDIVVGYPIANGQYKGTRDVIRPFVNTVALRTRFQENETFIDVLNRVKETILKAYQHKDIPFEQLVDSLNITRELNRNPIFQVMIAIQNTTESKENLDLKNLSVSPAESFCPVTTTKPDLSFGIYESKDGVDISIDYITDLFDHKTIERLAGNFKELIHAIAQDPYKIIHTYPILTSHEKYQLLIEWNDTLADYSKKTIHQLFEEQAKKTPDNIAIVYENQKLTYKELNKRANRLAHYLTTYYSITPDTLVPLLLDRSEYMIIAILGVLKAGGAYVPMDPSYPDDRISYILGDTRARVVLCNESYKERLKNISKSGTVIVAFNVMYPTQKVSNVDTVNTAINIQAEVIAIDGSDIQEHLVLQSIVNPITKTSSTNLTYVIYTSGTTGHPKGVMVEHGGVVNRIKWMNDIYPLKDTDKILQKTPYIFDVSVWELLWANLYGAALIFARPEGHKDANYLMDLIGQEDITILHFVPSMLSVFMDAIEVQKEVVLDTDISNTTKNIRYIFCSGEALNIEQVKQCHKSLSNIEIHNLYGPTEASIDILYYDCSNKDIKQVLIGKPISNSKAYILSTFSHSLTPLPIGAIGELYIGGVGLARGYLNQPELTSEKFISNPFQTEEEKADKAYGPNGRNSRLYKTGDLVRWLPCGNIEYIGRTDFQVKIRGYRIELGEIESVLSSFPGVKQCVVLAREHSVGIGGDSEDESVGEDATTISNNKYLVGYYTIASNEVPDESAIHSYLQTKLPDYMVPVALVHLESLPLTINGKLDRKALPEVKFGSRSGYGAAGSESYLALRSKLESKLCAIWAEVLRVDPEKISVHDNFFKLGGHSLLAIKVVIECQEVGINLELSELYESKDIITLAKTLSGKNSFTNSYNCNTSSKTKIPISLFQKDVWHLTKVNPRFFNVPLVLSIKGKININALEYAFNRLLQNHSSLRTIFVEKDKTVYQFIKSYKKFDLKVTDFSITKKNINTENIVSKYVNKEFNLKKQIPIKFSLIKTKKETYIFVLILHHLVIDGWSIDIIIKELNKCYNQFQEEKNNIDRSINLGNQYIDFSLNQSDYILSALSKINADEVKKTFHNRSFNIIKPMNEKLAISDSNKTKDSFDNMLIKLKYNSVGSDFLIEHKASIGTVILTIFKCLLFFLTNQKLISINFPVTVRPTFREKNTIGYFVNKFVVSTTFSETMTFKDIFNQVKKNIAAIKKYQNIPFSYLVEQLNLQEEINTQCNIMFINQNIDDETFNFKNLKIKSLNLKEDIILHDLLVELFTTSEEFIIKFIYKKNLFSRKDAIKFSLILDMAEHFEENLRTKLKDLKLRYFKTGS